MYTKEQLKNPDIRFRCDVRWWLAEGLHTDETLKMEIEELYQTGFGAAEFLAMEEPGLDKAKYGWGAEEWTHDTQTMVRETAERGMGVSMTCGTNWSNANLTCITPDDPAAAKELDYEVETIKAGSTKDGGILAPELFMPGVTKQDLIAVVAARLIGEKDGKTYLDEKKTIVLTDLVTDGKICWTAPDDGDYLLFYFWIHGTGQTAEPSCAISYTVNYMDREGIEELKKYWDKEILVGDVQKYLDLAKRGMMYMDSLELSTFAKGGQLWGYHFLDKFREERGYDLTPYLPFVVRQAGMMQAVMIYHYYSEDDRWAGKLYNDLYQTTTDCYIDNMMKPMYEWLHTHNMELRSEISYGLPFEISLPGKYVDGIETESLEFASQIDSYRGLAGAAHVFNKIYSSETGATLLNYMEGLDFYNQIIFTQFAAGVTRTVLHGYSSTRGSEAATQWPGHEGMWPIFSERFGRRQPAFVHYKDWTAMISRYQMVLRSGKPRMDLAMLRLDYNFNNSIMGDAMMGGTEEYFYAHSRMRANEGIYWKDMNLQNAGYTYDYFAPQILEETFVTTDGKVLLPDGPGYQALVIYQDVMPIDTAKKILELAKAGLPVLFVNGVTETTRPGVNTYYAVAASQTPGLDGRDDELAAVIAEIKAQANVRVIDDQAKTIEVLRELGITPRAAFAESNKKVLTCVREDGDQTYVYVYNMMYTDTENIDFSVKVQGGGKPYQVDCWNGVENAVGKYITDGKTTDIDITLAPGQAALYRFDRSATSEVHVIEADAPVCVCPNCGKSFLMAPADGSYKVTLSDGTVKTITASGVSADIDIPTWSLVVEDWNEGEKKIITEDRGMGFVSTEVDYETKKTNLPAVETTLIPWKDIPGVGPDVSGIGRYTAKVTLPETWAEEDSAVLEVGYINQGTMAVYVNGTKAGSADTNGRKVDITDFVKAGENEIMIEVSTSLCNRLLQRGYYEQSSAMSALLASNANNANDSLADNPDAEQPGADMMAGMAALIKMNARVRDYGITGSVVLRTSKGFEI